MLECLWVASLAVQAGQAADEPPPAAAAPEEIIVTGERVERTLKETPSSVDVATARQIEALAGADRIEQVLEQVPNVTLGIGGDGPAIRGQDTTGVLRDLPAFLGGNRPRTTLQVDGRAVSFNEFVFGVAPLWDIERVEVFRTPQTTTQGLNSIAGAIFVHSIDPSFEWEGRGRLIAGSDRMRQASATVSGPIIGDQLAFRVAGDRRRGLPPAEFTDTIRGADPNNDDYDLLRFKLLGQPRFWPGSRIELTYVHAESLMPGSESVRPPFRDRRNPAGTAAFETNVDSITAIVDHPITAELRASTTLSVGDVFVQRFSSPNFGETKTDIRDSSVETVLQWKPSRRASAVAGASYRRSSLDQFIDLSRFIGIGDFDDRQRSVGIFGEANFEIFPRTVVTAGLRYQRDSQQRSGAIGTADSEVPLHYDRSFSAWLPKLSIAHDFTDNIRAGVFVQRAYNPGGITLLLDTGQHEPFGAESLWNYELFARATLARELSVSANLFYTAMRDSQRFRFFSVSLPNVPPVTLAQIFNVPRARSYGAEITGEWRASTRFSARLAVGLLDTRIIEADAASEAFDGREFARAPGFTASGGIDWRPTDAIRLSAQVRHHSSYFSDDRETAAMKVGSATFVDARVAKEFGRVRLFAYARNVFDTFRLRSFFNTTLATAHDPRELGLGIEGRL